MTTTVLIVEDEPVLRASMVRGLSRLPDVVVLDAGRVDEAIRLAEIHSVDLVLSDLDLPDRSGLEIIGPLRATGRNPRIVFISAYLSTYRPRIPAYANVELREKPVPLEELRGIVEQHVGTLRRSSREPESTPFTAADYVQLSMMGRHSAVIGVAGGEIIIVDGQAWAARDALGTGDEAFMRLALQPNAWCRTLIDKNVARTVEGRAEFLLMEAARLQDEGLSAAASSSSSSLAAFPSPSGSSLSTSAPGIDAFDALMDECIDAILGRDHQRAAGLLSRARTLRPDDARVRANLQRLKALGVIDDAVGGGP
jgi:CheY-like chemotaxis protein